MTVPRHFGLIPKSVRREPIRSDNLCGSPDMMMIGLSVSICIIYLVLGACVAAFLLR